MTFTSSLGNWGYGVEKAAGATSEFRDERARGDAAMTQGLVAILTRLRAEMVAAGHDDVLVLSDLDDALYALSRILAYANAEVGAPTQRDAAAMARSLTSSITAVARVARELDEGTA